MSSSFDMEAVMEIEHGFGKGSKRPTDEAAPKRYLSAYFLWANKMRPSVMKDNPEALVGDLGKILGNMWKKTSAADRASFEAKAAKDRVVYLGKVEKYRKSKNFKKFQMQLHAWKIHETKKPYPRDTNAPKRPLTAYMLYSGSIRSKIVKENPSFTAPQVMKEQSIRWKAVTDKERKPWLEKGEAEKAKYQKKLTRYMKTDDYQGWVKGRDLYKKQMKEKRNRLMGIKKRAHSVSKPRAAKKQKRRSRRSRSPKSSKSRSSSRSASKKRSRRRRGSRSSRRKKAGRRSRRKGRRKSKNVHSSTDGETTE